MQDIGSFSFIGCLELPQVTDVLLILCIERSRYVIVKALRKEYNDIVWVSASLDGSRLKIQIKENEDALPIISSTQTDSLPVDLIASTDGIITNLITRTGIPQVHIGDSVTKGTLLVSGRIDILDDSGEITGYQYTLRQFRLFLYPILSEQDLNPVKIGLPSLIDYLREQTRSHLLLIPKYQLQNRQLIKPQ